MSVNSGIIPTVRRFLCVVLLSGLTCVSSAFVLIGFPSDHELSPTIGGAQFNNNLQPAAGAPVFGLGGPKGLKQFFRWNIPYLVYSFDASFINYFGFEGMEAVHDAYRVVNDFFVPEDGSYNGMSQLDLTKHGFSGNFNTSWANTTAHNAQIIDIKSMVLGMVVTELGIGNPHRHAFSMVGGTTNAWNTAYNFHVALRNYDPYSLKETDVINGVQYAYRLITDQTAPAPAAGALPAANFLDMEEYTADTSGNAWTAVTGILDAFYGDTMIYWTDQPTLFSFGIYYDGLNAMGGQYQPRHALTFDDAGGLKYLYNTNTYAWEANQIGGSVNLLTPAQLMPTTQAQMSALNSNWGGVPAGLHFQNNTGSTLPVFPRRGAIVPSFRYTLPIFGQPVIGSTPGNSWAFGANNIGPIDVSLRGGIDKIQFYHQPFDSLLGTIFLQTNFTWTVPFVYETGYDIGGLNNTTPGSSAWQGQKKFQFHSMTVGRNVIEPDFIFVCDDLGLSTDGIPIAFNRTDTNHYEAFTTNNTVGYVTGLNALYDVGPGVIHPMPTGAGTNITYTFTKLHQNFEMIWSGEATVVGNQDSRYSLWGHIKGPGPNDLIVFPRDATMWRIENAVIPDASPPTITMLSDTGGAAPIEQNTYTRTEETLTIIGSEMASVTAIEIMSGNLVLHTIMPVDKYIVSNTQIDLPPGLLSEVAEGVGLEIRVWNSVGVSQKGPQKFNIETGRPVITATTADGIVYDRAETLTVRGYGFKSRTVGQTQLAFIRVDDSQGSAIFDNGIAGGGSSDGIPTAVAFDVRDDTSAIIPINAISSRADGSNRRLRVARSTVTPPSDVNFVLSPPINELIAVITTKPVIASLAQNNAAGSWEFIQTTGMFKRDRVLEINGTALNTLDIIEVVNADGSSFPNPVFIQLPNAGVTVEDNGTRVLVGADSIPYSDADTNGTIQRAFRLYNAAGITDVNVSLLFAVNKQPTVTAVGGFANVGFFNRDKTLGDDVNIYGSGLQAIGEIHIVDVNGSDMNPSVIPRINLPHPGVTVTDGQILIDTQVAQFSGGTTADTDTNTTQRILKFVSARNNVTSPQADRFSVGVPPSIGAGAAVSASHATVGSAWVSNNYQRDTQNLFISGSGFGMAAQVEIVDMFGNQIVGALGVTPTSGLNVVDDNTIRIDANATGWASSTSLMDHVTAQGRRVKITTPYGSITSYGNSSGAFTVSAIPEYLPAATPIATATFAIDPVAGGGYSPTPGANGTYTLGNGPLVINGANLRGVNTIAFMHGGTPWVPSPNPSSGGTQDGNLTVDPNNPPAGITFNNTGTQILIDNVTGGIPAGWISQTDAWIYLNSAGNRTAISPAIVTTP